MGRPASLGMTLMELVIGLLVASIVASVVTVSLSIAARVHASHAKGWRDGDVAWSSLAAIANDVERGTGWHRCPGRRDCIARDRYRASEWVVEGLGMHTGWIADGTLYRCELQCHPFADGVRSLAIVADVAADAVRVAHGGRRTVELVLTLDDGRHFSRVVMLR